MARHKTQVVALRIGPQERAAWFAAAEREESSVSELVRDAVRVRLSERRRVPERTASARRSVDGEGQKR
jgi:hypothetical protein